MDILPINHKLHRAVQIVENALGLLVRLIVAFAFMLLVLLRAPGGFGQVVLHAEFFGALLDGAFEELARRVAAWSVA